VQQSSNKMLTRCLNMQLVQNHIMRESLTVNCFVNSYVDNKTNAFVIFVVNIYYRTSGVATLEHFGATAPRTPKAHLCIRTNPSFLRGGGIAR